MSCNLPCLTCPSSNYPDWCLSCDNSSVSFTVASPICWQAPMLLPQLIITCLFPALLLFPLLRKRSLTITHILSNLQTVAYFKFLIGQDYTRVNYLYAGMRAAVPWAEGWQVISLSGDVTMVGLGSMEETALNKLIRILAMWGMVVVMMLGLGVSKAFCSEGVTFYKFFVKNIGNAAMIAFFFTIQDITFFCMQLFYALPFSSTLGMILFACALLLVLGCVGLLLIMFSIINPQTPAPFHQYQNMFSLALDYDLFMTFELTDLPQKEKRIGKYSNIRLFEVGWKVGYAAMVIGFIFNTPSQGNQMIWSVFGYVLCSMIVWYIAMPYDHKKEYLQLILSILSDLLVLTLLVLPLIFPKSSSIAFAHMLILFGLPLLAILSALLQFFHPLYQLIPCDFYQTGMKIIVEDRVLRMQLQERKRRMEQDEQRMRQMRQQNEKLKEQMRLERQRRKQMETDQNQKKERAGEHSLQSINNKTVDQPEPQEKPNEMVMPSSNYLYPDMTSQGGSEEENEVNKYRIDGRKLRKMYQFDKKRPFTYSNKVQE